MIDYVAGLTQVKKDENGPESAAMRRLFSESNFCPVEKKTEPNCSDNSVRDNLFLWNLRQESEVGAGMEVVEVVGVSKASCLNYNS